MNKIKDSCMCMPRKYANENYNNVLLCLHINRVSNI